jgi:hypothetical protein
VRLFLRCALAKLGPDGVGSPRNDHGLSGKQAIVTSAHVGQSALVRLVHVVLTGQLLERQSL